MPDDIETNKLIDELVSDQKKFDDFVYTPYKVAKENQQINLLKRNKAISEYFDARKIIIPANFDSEQVAILFRHIATPNYETHRFLSICKTLNYKPVFLEYFHDKFISLNPCKKALGKIAYFDGVNERGLSRFHYETIINFNQFNGRTFGDIETVFGNSLIEFHHDIFFTKYSTLNESNLFEASRWFAENGGVAKEYYKSYLALFLRDAVLFDNFVISDKNECKFIREVFLPAFITILKLTGAKPIIVSLEPSIVESSSFWISYSPDVEKIIKSKYH